MDILRFPVALPGTTVGEAMDQMKAAKFSGIALPLDSRVNLIHYGDLVVGRTPRRTRLANIEIVRVAPRLTPTYARRLRLMTDPTLNMSAAQQQNIADFLKTSGYSFAVFGSGAARRSLNVLSMFETNLDLFRLAPLDCYCSNVHRPHPYDRNHPATCEFDGTEIVCG